MKLNDILLICAALLPAIALSIYIYKKDRAEKEPLGLLAVLLLLGVAICFPAAKLERIFSSFMNEWFAPYGQIKNGTLILPTNIFKWYMAIKAFAGVALVEEGLKFLVLVLLTRNNRNFNSLFDGVIYAVFVSLGFAAYENILYVLEFGWFTAFARAVMSVPGHTFFGVIMGYYYTLWNVHRKARLKEQSLINDGLIRGNIQGFPCTRYLVLALIMPVLTHGFYDYCCFVDSRAARIVLYVFMLLLYGYCFWRVYKLSECDASDTGYSDAMVRHKYPALYPTEKLTEESILR